MSGPWFSIKKKILDKSFHDDFNLKKIKNEKTNRLLYFYCVTVVQGYFDDSQENSPESQFMKELYGKS